LNLASARFFLFRDENNVDIQAATVLRHYDLNSWSYRELTDIIHHDRLDGSGNSTGVALPELSFTLEDNVASMQAASEYGMLQYSDVPAPLMSLGALALFGLALRGRR